MTFKEFIFGKPLELILKEVENFGKKLSVLADETKYSENKKGIAKHHKQNLEATRKAYKRLKNGEDPKVVIKELYLYVKDEDINKILQKTRQI